MTENFYNPYQFIPVTGLQDDSPRTVPFADIKQGNHAAIRHDLWQKNLKSGRIVCSVHLETPTVVGNQHDQPAPGEDRETIVYPYQIGGEYALPANSLRGMIGSVAETLSQSALRVLEEERYSVRKERSDGLSAIGLLRGLPNPGADEAALGIVPLSLPTVDVNKENWHIPTCWQKVFPGRMLADCLGAYINGYHEDHHQLRITPNSFLALNHHACFHEKRPAFFWAEIHPALRCPVNSDIWKLRDSLYGVKDFLLGQKLIGEPRTEQQFNSDYPPGHPDRCRFQRGILHVLGIDHRQDQIPAKQKKHERFIPVPDDLDTLQPIPITKEAWDDFMVIAAHRADSSKKERYLNRHLPFLPKSYIENKQERQRYWEPEAGELMYFRMENGRAVEISYTSIWREAKDLTIHDTFRAVNKNLLPWGDDERTRMTPAECLFGAIHGKKKDIRDAKSRNLASRVRFSDAISPKPIVRLKSSESDLGFRLKILASPKPPSPALYFQEKPSKRDLDLAKNHPSGRKYYLPHDSGTVVIPEGATGNYNPAWKSQNQGSEDKNKNQKARCRPFKEGQTFYFKIEFDNLADAELDLLLKSSNYSGWGVNAPRSTSNGF